MAQDRQGFIWLGSELGLSRFDGKTFYHKAVPEIYNNSSVVQYLETTHKGHVVCTAQMQGIFEQMDNGSFNNYYKPKRIGRNVYSQVKQGVDGELFVLSSRALYRVGSDTLLQLYDHGNDGVVFNTIDIDGNKAIWFGGVEGLGILEPSGSKYKPVFIPELKDLYIIEILFDKQDVLHVGTAQGYYRIQFDEPYRQGSKYTVTQPFEAMNTTPALSINHLYLDKEQNLWISTSTQGVYRTKGDEISLHLTKSDGLLSAAVMCVMQDRDGNYWFGTNNGLSMVADFNSYMLAKDGKLFQDPNSIVPDAFGRIWMPGPASFHVYEKGLLRQLDLRNTPLEKARIRSAVIDEQSVMWLYNYAELFRVKLTEALPDLRKVEKVADFSRYNPTQVRSVISDENGVWFCTRTKIFQYHHQRVLPVRFNHPDSSNLRPRVVLQDHLGYYWMGDYTYGLYRASLKENTKNSVVFDDIKVYKSLQRDSSFVTAWIQGLAVDKEGHLWEASLYTGIYKHTLDSTGVVSSKLYSTENGLLSNVVSGIDCGEDGRIWMYTQSGICILTQDAEGKEHFEYISKKDGIYGVPFGSIEYGNQLFTMTDEAIFVRASKAADNTERLVPEVVITELSVNGVDYTSWVYKNELLPLRHVQNNIAFGFSSITFNKSDDISYQYKLDGINQDWSELSDRGFVEYSALPHGKYTFKVRAVLSESVAGEESAFVFTIRSAYYQTIWFYLLIIIIVSALFYAFYRYRIRQIIKTERLRLRIAADLHDDLGSTLSSIFLMSEMAGNENKQARLQEVLRKIGNDSRDILNSMDDIIWSVNPQDDSLASLIVRLREYAIPVCESKDIDLSMKVEDVARRVTLSMDERRNIFLITKEAINNAVKHSECTSLEVTFVVTHRQIEVFVIDDGRGFDPKSPSSRNGLVNMQRRALQIGSELRIDSKKGRGTAILLRVKNHIFI